MLKERVIEFLLNETKYKVEKFVLFIFFWLLVLYLVIGFHISLIAVFITVLSFGLFISFLKILWYNRKKGIKTRGIIGLAFF
ncbi:hypothetical protein SAMN05216389_101162 [Oceanobacillus limi]|uniref:Uncharacterized protein n=1 Tax=Oceanobacillus limi TaxID=930131 RepID=A0A1H9Y346_9BACI|nr:hypothetical protein [Oceanobacillus limi]SES63231.1 hypothetical protein SAMN05216389_101162 [Oceanobacillus limi]